MLFRMLNPAIKAIPEVGGKRPVSTEIAVVLPSGHVREIEDRRTVTLTHTHREERNKERRETGEREREYEVTNSMQERMR